MTTTTPQLQPVINDFTESERSDMARLLIHANDLYQMYNSSATPSADRQISLDNAFDLITQVINFDPSNTPAMNLLGRIELDRGNIDTAKALFEQCLQHSPENTQYLVNKGYLHIISDEPELSLDYFQKSLEIDTGMESAFLGIARAQQALDNFDIAYLHYRSLVSHGHDDISILQGMLNCCANIQIHSYQTELEADLLQLYSHPELAHEKLGKFASDLICKKYDLENPNAPIDIIDAANDPLIYHSLLKCSLSNPFVEEFITLLRESILIEATETRYLREELQLLAIAIGVNCERNNFALLVKEEESVKVAHFDEVLTQTLHNVWLVEDIAGAVIILGMYQAFFSQSYAVRLTALDLFEWPLALQPLLKSSLYLRAEREAFKQSFPEKQDDLLIGKEDIPAPYPRSSCLDFFNPQSLKDELTSNFKVDKNTLPDRLLLLVAGVDASQKALGYAKYFTDVDVLAVESSLNNLSEGQLKAQEQKLSNIAFWPLSLATRFMNDGNQIHFAAICDDTNMLDQGFMSLVQHALVQQGILNYKLLKSPDSATQDIQSLVTKQKLPATTANIRALRSTILTDKYSAYWSDLINSEYFYSVDGCRDEWFNNRSQNDVLGMVSSLLDGKEWNLAKVLNHHRKDVAATLVKKHIQKFTNENHVSNEYSIYLVKR